MFALIEGMESIGSRKEVEEGGVESFGKR